MITFIKVKIHFKSIKILIAVLIQVKDLIKKIVMNRMMLFFAKNVEPTLWMPL